MSWRALRETYLEQLAALGRSRATLVLARRWLTRFEASARRQGARELAAVTPDHLAAFQRELAWCPNGRGGVLAAASQALALQMVRRWLGWATRRGALLVDPARDLVVKAPPRALGRVPSVAEVERLLAVPSTATPIGLRDRAILATLYATGIRRGECHRLDLLDLDLAQGQLAVRQGKGGKSRLLPVLPHLVETLERYLTEARPALLRQPEQAALFLDRWGRRLSRDMVGILVARHACAAGLGRLGAHGLRRAFATHLLEGGADVAALMALLGHANLDSTERYAQLIPGSLARVHARTHPRA